jgi:glycosyltransferase involved in cell wall biosynthesis
MKYPLISIITPTYNAASTVEKCLLSTINQSYKVIEHIFVDNHSEDATTSIIRDYQKRYNHIRLLSEKDSGLYDAVNKGMNLCTGDWLYVLGADDEFYNDDVLMELYEQGRFDEEQIVYGDVLIRGETVWAKNNSVYDGLFTLEKLFRKNICHQSIFYPHSVIQQVGYYSEKYAVTADWDYNVRCFVKYKFSYVNKIIALFTGGGKSSGGDASFFDDLPEKVIQYFQLDPEDITFQDPESPFYYPVSRFRMAH